MPRVLYRPAHHRARCRCHPRSHSVRFTRAAHGPGMSPERGSSAPPRSPAWTVTPRPAGRRPRAPRFSSCPFRLPRPWVARAARNSCADALPVPPWPRPAAVPHPPWMTLHAVITMNTRRRPPVTATARPAAASLRQTGRVAITRGSRSGRTSSTIPPVRQSRRARRPAQACRSPGRRPPPVAGYRSFGHGVESWPAARGGWKLTERRIPTVACLLELLVTAGFASPAPGEAFDGIRRAAHPGAERFVTPCSAVAPGGCTWCRSSDSTACGPVGW
jgi:hypothetical protein